MKDPWWKQLAAYLEWMFSAKARERMPPELDHMPTEEELSAH